MRQKRGNHEQHFYGSIYIIGMVSRRCMVTITVVCALGISGCIFQEEGEYVSTGTSIEIYSRYIFATDEYLYVMSGKVTCFDWEGVPIWESPKTGGDCMAFLGDSFFVDTYDRSTRKGGVAFLNDKGEILWQKETGMITSVGVSASHDLLAAGTHHDGVLWAFSKSGDVLWTYRIGPSIEQVLVAPDSSCVVCTDFHDYITCISDGQVWEKYVGSIYTGGSNRTVACAPDCSYLVYRNEINGPQIAASTLYGDELWSFTLENSLQSVAITEDSASIIAACHNYVYKLTSDGTLVWKIEAGADNKYVALSSHAEYIAIGAISPLSRLIVLDAEGTILWKAKGFDNIFSVAISPDGTYVAFSSKTGQVYIFENPPV